MKSVKLRKQLDNYGIENDLVIKLFEKPAYDKSIIGITTSGQIVYDFDKMVQEYAQDYNCSELEAIEWVETNVLPSLSFEGENKPIIIYNIKEIKGKY